MSLLAVLAGVVGVVLVTSLNSGVSAMSDTVRAADELATSAGRLRSALLDQETGLRGFQLTGSDAFLQPYRTGLRAERGAVDALLRNGTNGDLLVATQEASRQAYEWRANWAIPLIAMVEAGDLDAARARAATGEGRLMFDQVRGALGRVDLAIADVRADALASIEQRRDGLVTVIVFAVTLYGATLLLGALWALGRVAVPMHRLVSTAEALERGEPVHFSSGRADEIGTLAETLERLRLAERHRYETVNHLAERSTILNRLSELISYANDEAAVVRAGGAALERLVPNRGGEVLLVNPSFDQLRVHAVWGAVETPGDGRLAIDRPTACPGIRRNAVHVTRSALDAFSLTCEIHPLRSGSLVCVPMVALNEMIGVIHLERAEEDAFSEDDVHTASRVAEQVALAMANLRLMRRMETQAMSDPLTGLANPRSFDPLVERELAIARRDGQPAAIIMLDLDHFKQFNDAHGHPAGDEALRAFARTVRGSLRETDVAARYGGEEFAILLRNTDLEGAAVTAEKVRAAIEMTPIEIGPNRFVRITASMGVAASDRHGSDRVQLMRLADAALYEAKHDGRNRVAIAPGAPPPARAEADVPPTSIRGRLRTGRARGAES